MRERFLADLQALQLPGCFNPWTDIDEDFDIPEDGPGARRRRLAAHLDCPDAKLILIGEAPGYQGCRASGLGFTSEALILDGAIPRVRTALPRLTSRPRPWSEPSARIVWGVLYRLGIAEQTILWNACPLHPMPPGKAHGNRKPRAGEVAAGRPFLEALIGAFPAARVAAVGRTSEGLLARMGIEATGVRHPAYGGKADFERGVGNLVASI